MLYDSEFCLIYFTITKCFHVTGKLFAGPHFFLKIIYDSERSKELCSLFINHINHSRKNGLNDILNSPISLFYCRLCYYYYFVVKIILMSLGSGEINHTLSFHRCSFRNIFNYFNNILNKALTRSILVEYRKKRR